MRRVFAALVVLCATVTTFAAPPLVDQVPRDAIVYIAFAGSNNLGPNFEGSHLQKVLAASNFQKFYRELVPRVLEKTLAQDAQKATDVGNGLSAIEIYARHGAAFYVCARPSPAPSAPEYQVGVICDAGDDAANLAKWLKDLTKSDHNVSITQTGNLVRLIAGKLKPEAPGLLQAGSFSSALKQVNADPMYIAYVDIERAIELFDQSIGKDAEAKTILAVQDSLGLNGLKRFIMTGALVGQDFSAETFAEAAEPRNGLLSLWDQGPVDAGVLARVPSSATFIRTLHLNLAGLHKILRQAATVAGEDAVQQYDRALGMLQMYLGANPVSELFEPLGSDWAIYQLPAQQPEAAMLDTVIVAKVKDGKKAAIGMRALSYAVANLTQNPRFNLGGNQLTVKPQKLENFDVTTLQGQNISPSWAIVDGFIYIAASPERLLDAVKYKGPGFKENSQFAALQKRLALSSPPRSFEFVDLKAIGPSSYAAIRSVVDMGLMAASAQGMQLPANPMPTLQQIQPEFEPVAKICWTDKDGIHTRSQSPFPGASIVSGSGLVEVGTASLAVSILLPSLNRARETANRVTCAAHEREIARALVLYSRDHNGAYPADLGELIKTQDIGIESFVCPASDTSIPQDVIKKGKDAMADWINTNSDYVYVKGKHSSIGADDIILYEKFADHAPDGINITYGDGRVLWQRTADAIQELERCKIPVPQDAKPAR